ncbi:MAG: hypothetical protein V4555_15045 [Acidobacteriota bacterium]
MAELKLIAKRLQLRKVPAGISIETLREVLLSTVGDSEVHAEPLCICGHLKRAHYLDNETGEAFECKRPSCGCTRFTDAHR